MGLKTGFDLFTRVNRVGGRAGAHRSYVRRGAGSQGGCRSGWCDVGVAEQFLHRAQVAAGFQQMGRERVAQHVRMHVLRQAHGACVRSDRSCTARAPMRRAARPTNTRRLVGPGQARARARATSARPQRRPCRPARCAPCCPCRALAPKPGRGPDSRGAGCRVRRAADRRSRALDQSPGRVAASISRRDRQQTPIWSTSTVAGNRLPALGAGISTAGLRCSAPSRSRKGKNVRRAARRRWMLRPYSPCAWLRAAKVRTCW